MLYFFFFFQAEDGIRDFCLSRGLGDVYKRQIMHVSHITLAPVSSMRVINDLQRSATNREVQIQRGCLTVCPSKSRAISVSSEREQCGHPNTTTSGSLDE